ncbi:MAG TPA: DUF6526 family protein [Gemmatimonadaceae bacterium]|nr:DUF6526 family protein [Gemmatimonadaceae bacterium]
MPRQPQTYANHRRYLALYHFFALPILVAHVVVQVVRLVRVPSVERGWDLAVALALVAGLVAARVMALIVQNRLVGFETRLRLATVLPAELRTRIPELRLRQLIGLRFAGDDELPALVARCLSGELRTADDVKRQVVHWRADWQRV